MGGKFFSSYRKAFELAQSFQDSQKSDLNCSYDALVKKEALSSALGRFKQMCYRLSWNSFCPKDRASSCKSHHILWLNINGFLACKINHFAQNKFKVKNAQFNSKNQLNFQGLKKKKTEAMDVFLSIIPSRTIAQIFIPTKIAELHKKNSKRAGKVSLVKIELTKCCKPSGYCKCKTF